VACTIKQAKQQKPVFLGKTSTTKANSQPRKSNQVKSNQIKIKSKIDSNHIKSKSNQNQIKSNQGGLDGPSAGSVPVQTHGYFQLSDVGSSSGKYAGNAFKGTAASFFDTPGHYGAFRSS
jgi:hypothetical protein